MDENNSGLNKRLSSAIWSVLIAIFISYILFDFAWWTFFWIVPVSFNLFGEISRYMKASRNCYYCGASIKPSTTYCNACGKEILRNCPKCDADLSHRSKFCEKCGYNIEEHLGIESLDNKNHSNDLNENKTKSEIIEETTRLPIIDAPHYCPGCGARFSSEEDHKKCSICGFDLN